MCIRLGVVCVLLGTIAILGSPPTSAQGPKIGEPGSVLIYPLYDSSPGIFTYLSVTNTNESEFACGNGFREGDVLLRFLYFDGVSCSNFARFELMSPADTLTVITAQHNPDGAQGYLVIQALDPETMFPMSFDYLLGHASILDTMDDVRWSYLPYSFAGLGNVFLTECAHPVISPDSVDAGTPILFDGVDYAFFPGFLALDHFEGVGTASSTSVEFDQHFYFMSGTRPASAADLNLSFSAYNNNEVRFTRNLSLPERCWYSRDMLDLSAGLSQQNLAVGGNASELSGVAYGWMGFEISDAPGAAILGVVVSTVQDNGTVFRSGRTLTPIGSIPAMIDPTVR